MGLSRPGGGAPARRASVVIALGALAVLRALGVLGALGVLASSALGATPQERFRAAGELARRGDYPRAIAAYQDLAASGFESGSLYWNWSQAAMARGATGEALWALLRARELDPSDRAVWRGVDRLREAANLDRAEIAPDPLASVARAARRFWIDRLAVLLLAASLAAHAAFKWRRSPPRLVSFAWVAFVMGLCAAILPVAGAFARPTGAVVHRAAPLLDAASPTAESVGTLREGEVVPILESSGAYVRVEDSSGARGWAHAADVRWLTRAPRRGS